MLLQISSLYNPSTDVINELAPTPDVYNEIENYRKKLDAHAKHYRNKLIESKKKVTEDTQLEVN